MANFLLLAGCSYNSQAKQYLKVDQDAISAPPFKQVTKAYFFLDEYNRQDWDELRRRLEHDDSHEGYQRIEISEKRQQRMRKKVESEYTDYVHFQNIIIQKYFSASIGWLLLKLDTFSQQSVSYISEWLETSCYSRISLWGGRHFLVKGETDSGGDPPPQCPQIIRINSKINLNVSTLMGIARQGTKQQLTRFRQLILGFGMNIRPFFRVCNRVLIYFELAAGLKGAESFINFMIKSYEFEVSDCIQLQFCTDDIINLPNLCRIQDLSYILRQCRLIQASSRDRLSIVYYHKDKESSPQRKKQKKENSLIQRLLSKLLQGDCLDDLEANLEALQTQLEQIRKEYIRPGQDIMHPLQLCYNLIFFHIDSTMTSFRNRDAFKNSVFNKCNYKIGHLFLLLDDNYKFNDLSTSQKQWRYSLDNIRQELNMNGGLGEQSANSSKTEFIKFLRCEQINLLLDWHYLGSNQILQVGMNHGEQRNFFGLITNSIRRQIASSPLQKSQDVRREPRYLLENSYRDGYLVFKNDVPVCIIPSPKKISQFATQILPFICLILNKQWCGVVLMDECLVNGSIRLKGCKLSQQERDAYRKQLKTVSQLIASYEGDPLNLQLDFVPVFDSQRLTERVIPRIKINDHKNKKVYLWRENANDENFYCNFQFGKQKAKSRQQWGPLIQYKDKQREKKMYKKIL